MKLCRFNSCHVGVVVGDLVHDITPLMALETRWPVPPGDLVIAQLAHRQEVIRQQVEGGHLRTLALAEVRLDSPVANPSKIIGAPINYRAHIDEANADEAINHGKSFTSLDQFGLFLKANSCLIGPSDAVRLRFADRRNDHEVELAVVIGRGGAFIDRDNALEHVFGYAIGLDMTTRGPEFPGFRKSPDTYGVLGPWITTRDEVENPNALALSLHVNGEQRQRASTSQLIFDVQALIVYASRFYTLHPGDIIMTGTPEGVSQVLPGDVMDAQIEKLGSMRTRIDSAWVTA